MVHSSVSPGEGPEAPTSVTTWADFCVAIERAVTVASAPFGSISTTEGVSRGSSGVQIALSEALLGMLTAAPVDGDSTGSPEASRRGTQNPRVMDLAELAVAHSALTSLSGGSCGSDVGGSATTTPPALSESTPS